MKKYKMIKSTYYEGYSANGKTLVKALDEFCKKNDCSRKDVSITTFGSSMNYENSCSEFQFSYQRFATDEEYEKRLEFEKRLLEIQNEQDRKMYKKLKAKFENE